MLLFTPDQSRAVRNFVLNLVNTHCVESQRFNQDPRLENRVNLSVVVSVVPVEDNAPRVDKSFTTVTKDFSSLGVSLIVDKPRPLDDVILAFPRKSGPTYVRGRIRHLSPMGEGFFQLGVKMNEIVSTSDYPELKTLAGQAP